MGWQMPFVISQGISADAAKIIIPRKIVLAIYQRMYWVSSLLHL
tara:strand:- start:21 stop:152 length:132 start_codon:yes stop_codon:yes gene_type:complete